MNLQLDQILVAAGLYLGGAVALRRLIPWWPVRALAVAAVGTVALYLIRTPSVSALPFVLMLVASAMAWVETSGLVFRIGLYRWESMLALYAVADAIAPGIIPAYGAIAGEADLQPIRAWILENGNQAIAGIASMLPHDLHRKFVLELAGLPIVVSANERGVLGVGFVWAVYGIGRIAGDVRAGTFFRYSEWFPLLWLALALASFPQWSGIEQTMQLLLTVAGARLLSAGAAPKGTGRAALFGFLVVGGVLLPRIGCLLCAVTVVESAVRLSRDSALADATHRVTFVRFGRAAIQRYYASRPVAGGE